MSEIIIPTATFDSTIINRLTVLAAATGQTLYEILRQVLYAHFNYHPKVQVDFDRERAFKIEEFINNATKGSNIVVLVDPEFGRIFNNYWRNVHRNMSFEQRVESLVYDDTIYSIVQGYLERQGI